MRVLAIGAHPDDLENLCGGTLALCAARGDEVYMAVATNGNVGSPTLSREEIAAIRHEEAQKSADIIGAKLIWMDFPDEFLFNDKETRLAFIDVIRETRPDIMFIHGTNDYHPDHRIAGQVALDASIPAAVRLIETRHPACNKIPAIFIMDNVGGIDFEPEVYVDTSEIYETKKKMWLLHQSQQVWLQSLYGDDNLSALEAQSRNRGKENGTHHAEAFRMVKTFPLTDSRQLLPS